MMRVCIVSENKSFNLGDIAIFDSLCCMLSESYSITSLNLSEASYDLKDRVDLPEIKKFCTIKLILKKIVPMKIIAELRWYFGMGLYKYKKYVLKKISDSDIVLIGGGQLLKENLSLFPNRLAVICRESKKRNIPYLFFGVGVDEKVGIEFKIKMKSALKNASGLVFRDRASKSRVDYLYRNLASSTVCPDPCFSGSFHKKIKSRSVCRDVAINIMSIPSMLKASNRLFGLNCSESNFRDAFLGILNYLSTKGCRLSIFTTGSTEDFVELMLIADMYQTTYGQSLHSFHPQSVDELSCYLLTTDKVLATRMHAGIMAHSLLCNVITVNWDPKVHGVWSLVDGEKRVVCIGELLSKSFPVELDALFRVLGSPQRCDVDQIEGAIRKILFSSLGCCFL